MSFKLCWSVSTTARATKCCSTVAVCSSCVSSVHALLCVYCCACVVPHVYCLPQHCDILATDKGHTYLKDDALTLRISVDVLVSSRSCCWVALLGWVRGWAAMGDMAAV